MSYYQYNADKQSLINSYTKVKQNINEINPFDDTYKSFDTLRKESENILKKEQTIFIITSTITAFLTAYTLKTILK